MVCHTTTALGQLSLQDLMIDERLLARAKATGYQGGAYGEADDTHPSTLYFSMGEIDSIFKQQLDLVANLSMF